MSKKENSIVVIYNDEPRAGSHLIAQGFKRTHEIVLQIIRKYKTDLEEFGKLPFTSLKLVNSKKGENKGRKTRGRPVKAYMLNEEQTTLLGTLFRNSDIVITFKKRLIREFFKQRKILRQVINNRESPEWIQKRLEGKARRLDATDTIKKFVEYAKKQNSKHADWYYKLFTDLENKALFVVEGKFKNLRDVMSADQLITVCVADRVIEKAIKEGMQQKIYYKIIYQHVKENMLAFAQLHGQDKIIAEIKKLEAPLV